MDGRKQCIFMPEKKTFQLGIIALTNERPGNLIEMIDRRFGVSQSTRPVEQLSIKQERVMIKTAFERTHAYFGLRNVFESLKTKIQ